MYYVVYYGHEYSWAVAAEALSEWAESGYYLSAYSSTLGEAVGCGAWEDSWYTLAALAGDGVAWAVEATASTSGTVGPGRSGLVAGGGGAAYYEADV